MAAAAEHDFSRAARILAAARELVLKRGVKGLTIAEIAQRAHVGKGTAYLYWDTKEDLVFELFARDFLAGVEQEIDTLTADPDLARPRRLCPRLVHTALDRPFVRALQTGDADLLGVLTHHPRSRELLDMLGPAALTETVLPVWRRNRLARTDWPLEEQGYVLHALVIGFLEVATRAQVLPGVTVDDPDQVMAAAVTALLGPEEASPTQVRAAAAEGRQLLRERRETLLTLITTNHKANQRQQSEQVQQVKRVEEM
ncbi:DNA-binding transcriptional regulator, AcrR family [Streptomyces sp. 3213]|uniref:TetR/AcrR family transcriptional regulator n=1 Tax=Streptomyces sp. 3213.3 TaxID=1855348 RepID=UPI00089B5928|nr:TetR/AcrR family transcriptional regulator [Streptomyces sp. 3213.3]SEF04350.1 DNA-binding transcriptional regulator, AcrR family [Streptomyces sp. 3213] [Streptomyces sp. 3213.3]